jgi:hypothetical protein
MNMEMPASTPARIADFMDGFLYQEYILHKANRINITINGSG